MSERYLVVTSSNRSVSKKLNTFHAFVARSRWWQKKLTSTIEDVRNLSSVEFEVYEFLKKIDDISRQRCSAEATQIYCCTFGGPA